MLHSSVKITIATLVCAVVGCSGEAPNAEFVSSERTVELMREASSSVSNAVDTNFGTPHDLIAWRKLPINYGETEGVIEGAAPGEGNDQNFRFAVNLNVADNAEQPDFRNLALEWQTGQYASSLVTVDAEGVESPVGFSVSEYDEANKTLTIEQMMDPPPQPGDKFAIVGENLQKGRMSYMRYCMHCHGVSGDGNGPTAMYLNPRPRDYRLGIFKFTSTASTDKATRDDLRRIIKHGIPGTYMPSFMLLDNTEVDRIVEYIRWLTMRGEFEQKLVAEFESDYSRTQFRDRTAGGESADDINNSLAEFIQSDYPDLVVELSDDLAKAWTRAEEESSLVVPKTARTPDDHASRERGRQLFLGGKAKCLQCHGPTGKGNGAQTEDFQKIPGTEDVFAERGLHDAWGNVIKPRNLTSGIYRGGRRPIDIYRRIYAGIKGTPMAGNGTSLTNEEIWDLVNYVLSIPFNSHSPASAAPAAEQVAANASSSADGSGISE